MTGFVVVAVWQYYGSSALWATCSDKGQIGRQNFRSMPIKSNKKLSCRKETVRLLRGQFWPNVTATRTIDIWPVK